MRLLAVLGPTFYKPKWQITLPFHIFPLVKSEPFIYLKHPPFRAEPPHIDHYRKYPR